MTTRTPRRRYDRVKRLIDVAASAVLLVTLSPLLTVLAWAVRRRHGSPVFFTQERPGLHGRPFTIIKFRTMTDERDEDGELLPDHRRMTKLGMALRSSSADELPELWNVLRGEMSLVGPRPLLMEYLALYTDEQQRRHDVRPGITGLAQINGRNDLTWDDKLALDVWYVDHRSLWLDVRILARTLLPVLRRTGISQAGHATVEPFRGSASGNGPAGG